MDNYFKTQGILNMVLKWKWHLIALIIIAGILGVVFSSPYFIKPQFKSTAVLYPSNIKSISDESESEQMLEIIQSTDIQFRVIDALNLYEHYGIDRNDNQHRTKVSKIYNGNISFKKTQNEAIQITAFDEDPQMASDIIDSIIVYFSDFTLFLNTSQSEEYVKIYKKERDKKLVEIDSIADLLKDYRTGYGLLDMEAQVKKYTEAINNGKNVSESRDVLNNWKEYGAEYIKLDSLFHYALQSYNVSNTIFENVTRDANKEQTYCSVISKPYPADKKASPVRWIIVLVSMLGAAFAGLIIVAIIEGTSKKHN